MERNEICPYCKAYAGMSEEECYLIREEERIKLRTGQEYYVDDSSVIQRLKDRSEFKLKILTCRSCGKIQILLDDKRIYPDGTSIEPPNQNMPDDVKELYVEASKIYEKSPKSAAALLRLALQKLCKALGGKGKNINSDIAILVEKGLPHTVQKAMDSIRVIGNNAVHPGEINLDEAEETVVSLFKILNFIVDKMISEPKVIDEIYSSLPKASRQAIENR